MARWRTKIKVRLGLRKNGCESEGKARGLGTIDRQVGEAQVESLTMMDRGNDGEQERLWLMDQ
jgi:hypothetical protein